MRAGTTSLARYLTRNDDVYMVPEKEVHFFDRSFDKGLGWYEDHFSSGPQHSAVGEATPSYVHDKLAIERIAKTIPDVKLLMLLRNPVDRAYSHYWHNRWRARESLSFEEAIAEEPKRLLSSDADRAIYSYIDRGRYLDQLRRVLTHFPRNSLDVFLYEDLRDDTAGTLKKIWSTLGCDLSHTDWDKPFERFNAYVEFRSDRVRRLASEWGGPVGRVVGRLNAIKSVEYPPMRPDTRRELQSLFAAANLGLDPEFGLDTSSVWT